MFFLLCRLFVKSKKKEQRKKNEVRKEETNEQKENKAQYECSGNIRCDQKVPSEASSEPKMQIRDLTSAADSAKSIIFTAAASPQRTHTLQTICAVCVRVCGQNT